jgi:hypothetical protein
MKWLWEICNMRLQLTAESVLPYANALIVLDIKTGQENQTIYHVMLLLLVIRVLMSFFFSFCVLNVPVGW